MRILLATLFFPPEHNAGTENYTLALASSLLARGHEVEVVCAGAWSSGDSYWNGVTQDKFEDVPIHRIQFNWTKANDPNQVLYYSHTTEEWFDKYIKDKSPDVVHVTSAITLGIGVLRSVRRARLPLILTLTDFWFICPTLQLLRSNGSLCDGETTAWDCQSCLGAGSGSFRGINSLVPQSKRPQFWSRVAAYTPVTKRRGFRGITLDMAERKQMLEEALLIPDRVFAPSKFVQQVISRVTSTPVEVLHHGHDLTWRDDLGPKKPGDVLRFAYMGQIQPIKGVQTLIEAFQEAQIEDRATLSIFGDTLSNPEYMDELNKIANGNPSILFRGRFARDELAEVFADIDVVVVPSIWYENAPLVIQEAFAAGSPVIATDLGGMAEAVDHEVNGLLFERGDVESLAIQLRRIVEETGLLGQLQEGIPPVKTIQQEIDELEAIYSGLIDQS